MLRFSSRIHHRVVYIIEWYTQSLAEHLVVQSQLETQLLNSDYASTGLANARRPPD